MADILGIQLPKTKMGAMLAGLALVSVPIAAVVGAGLGVRALYRRWAARPETDEEKIARLERAAYPYVHHEVR